jgi:hypothetical protein
MFINTRMPFHIDGVMVSVLASSVVGLVFEPRLGQVKDFKIGTLRDRRGCDRMIIGFIFIYANSVYHR